MLNKHVLKWLLPAAAMLLALPVPSIAYVYFFTYSTDIGQEDGFRFHWDDNAFPITYAINQNGTNEGLSLASIENAIDYSFGVWQNVSAARVEFSDGGWTTINRVAANNVNLVIFDTNTDSYKLSEKVGASVVGLTINSYSPSTGRISDSDIIFNDQEYSFTTTQASDLSLKRINLQDVATHEIGHLLGLDHTWIEHATMWPYTRDGQKTLSEDDRAGIGNLYPSAAFNTAYDSLKGTVYNVDGRPVMGVYVSAISDSSGLEEVAALTDTIGHYSIRGLKRNTNYYLRARNVELKHVGDWYETQADSTVYIPKYYPDASNRTSATKVNTSQSYLNYDFSLTNATLVSRFDLNATITSYISFGSQTSSFHYIAVKYPVSVLPEAFKLHGLSFYNSDVNMLWPSIMVTTGTDAAPDINNPIRQVTNFEGAEQAITNVDWEAVQLTNARTLWVVFQFPDKPSTTWGDGPGIAAVPGNGTTDIYYSDDGGKTFKIHSSDYQYNLWLYMNAEITGTALIPAVEWNVNAIDFGKSKIGSTTYKKYPIGNTGTLVLELKDYYCSSLAYTVSVDNKWVEPGTYDTLRIGFKAPSKATWGGTLTILTDDPARTQIELPVTGSGVYAKVQLASAALAFDSVGLGAAATKNLTIRSTGEVPLLAWGWNTNDPDFTVTAAADTLEIPAGDSASVSVRFAPQAAGSHDAVLSFTTDDSAKTTHQVALSGTAAGDPNAPRCDMTGDGRANIIDLLALILFSRHNPSDPRLDWNGDGTYTIADAVFMLNAIRHGTCPDISGTSFLAGDILSDPWLESLSSEDRAWLRDNLLLAGLTSDERELALAALNTGGGRSSLPGEYSLEQNHPNPFNPSTSITFDVPDDGGGQVSLKIYSISGRLVRTLVQGFRGPGVHTVFWDGTGQSGRQAASGVYIYRLQAGGRAWTRKMVLLK